MSATSDPQRLRESSQNARNFAGSVDTQLNELVSALPDIEAQLFLLKKGLETAASRPPAGLSAHGGSIRTDEDRRTPLPQHLAEALNALRAVSSSLERADTKLHNMRAEVQRLLLAYTPQ